MWHKKKLFLESIFLLSLSYTQMHKHTHPHVHIHSNTHTHTHTSHKYTKSVHISKKLYWLLNLDNCLIPFLCTTPNARDFSSRPCSLCRHPIPHNIHGRKRIIKCDKINSIWNLGGWGHGKQHSSHQATAHILSFWTDSKSFRLFRPHKFSIPYSS